MVLGPTGHAFDLCGNGYVKCVKHNRPKLKRWNFQHVLRLRSQSTATVDGILHTQPCTYKMNKSIRWK